MTHSQSFAAKSLKIWLESNGKNQRWLAKRLRKDPATITRWMSGEKTPDYANRRLINHITRYMIRVDEWDDFSR